MGPAVLFDKSFLQSISIDESVWFDRFFIAVICPIFYIETLGDLAKSTSSDGRPASVIVREMAKKFPELSGCPCVFHVNLAIGDLLGHEIPMCGQIPRPGARKVRSGSIFEETPEEAAFRRWQDGSFTDVERIVAAVWRDHLATLDLAQMAAAMRELGFSSKSCKSLQDAYDLAFGIVSSSQRVMSRIRFAVQVLRVPERFHPTIVQRWQATGQRPLHRFAPYAAHVLTVELFFNFALAAGLIASERPSNRTDIAYLFYLPFCHMFVSWDKLHRRCAAPFLRADQTFVWAPDLKADLKSINAHFLKLPVVEREKGVMKFANGPPRGSLVDKLWRSIREPDDFEKPLPGEGNPLRDAELVRRISEFRKQPTLSPDDPAFAEEDEMMSITRKVSRKRGSWTIIAKRDLPSKDG